MIRRIRQLASKHDTFLCNIKEMLNSGLAVPGLKIFKGKNLKYIPVFKTHNNIVLATLTTFLTRIQCKFMVIKTLNDNPDNVEHFIIIEDKLTLDELELTRNLMPIPDNLYDCAFKPRNHEYEITYNTIKDAEIICFVVKLMHLMQLFNLIHLAEEKRMLAAWRKACY